MRLGFLDTVKEDAVRIRKGRKNLHRGILCVLVVIYLICFIVMFALVTNNFVNLYFGLMLFVALIVLYVGMIIKREIYSVVILLKELEEKAKW